MIKNGIVIDSNRKFRNEQLILSEIENQIIEGCLLGDGHITKPRGKSCQFSYCSSEYEHVYYVYSKLKRMMAKEYGNGPKKYEYFDKRTNKTYIQYSIRSQSNITFHNLRKLWYPHGIKIIPNIIKLTSTSLLFWYIGDGGLINGERCQYIKLSTNCFSDNNLLNILLPLLKCFSPKLYGKKQKVIYIPHNKIKKFLDKVGNCPVECYSHKWKYKEYKYEIYERLIGQQNEGKL